MSRNTEQNRELVRKAKISFIGFDTRRYKPVTFNKKEHKDILIGLFVKFRYGATEKKVDQVNVVGKVYRVERRGVHVVTDCGHHCPVWKRIDKVYIEKQTRPKKKSLSKMNTRLAML